MDGLTIVVVFCTGFLSGFYVSMRGMAEYRAETFALLADRLDDAGLEIDSHGNIAKIAPVYGC